MKSSNTQWDKYAHNLWYMSSGFAWLDQLVDPFLSENIPPEPEAGWLKTARQALLLSTGRVAKKLKISRAAYSAFEEREREGKITLNNLRRMAEAMDCELVYALRPKRRIRFSEVIWEKLIEGESKHPMSRSESAKSRAYALLSTVQKRFRDPEFRRRQQWTER